MSLCQYIHVSAWICRPNAAKSLQVTFSRFRKRWWNVFNIIFLPFAVALFIGSIAANLFLIAYIFFFLNTWIGKDAYFGFMGILFLGLLWAILVSSKIDNLKTDKGKYVANRFFNILIVSFIIGLLWINNQEKAKKVLSGKPPFTAKFEMADSLLRTDTVIVFVGQSHNYIFLRNLESNENIVIQKESVKKLFLKTKE